MAGLLLFQAAFVVAILLVLSRVLLNRKAQNATPLPPGPRGLPLVGNVSDLPPPGEVEFRHWLKHKDQYGPISSVTVLGTTMVIIHDKQAAFELMDMRANTHSGRPKMKFGFDMCGWINTMSGQQLGSTLRLYRRYAHQQLGTKAASLKFQPIQEAAVGRFLWRINRDQGDHLNQHLKTEAAELMLNMLYGYNIEPHSSDLLASRVEEAMDQFTEAAIPGKWMVDIFPLLEYVPEWMPGTEFKRIARRWNRTLSDVVNMPYEFAKQRMAQGTNDLSFVTRSIEQSQAEKGEKRLTAEEEHAIKWSAASLYAGGADTSVGTMETFFLAMVMYPEVQQKAQQEIDSVTGGTRLPTFSDRENLSYINAIVEEAQRWHPIAGMGLPHTTIEDDYINGYRIPKDAILMPMIWWYSRDPAVYHEPDAFIPERYSKPYNEPPATDFTFGFGRRVCPGRVLADSSLFLTFAQSLAVFDIKKPLDDSGKEVEQKHDFLPGIICHPTRFSARVVPRSEEHARLIAKVIEDHPWPESDAKYLESIKY